MRDGAQSDDEKSNTLEHSRSRLPSPIEDANLFSHLLFSWAWPLLKVGNQKILEEEDLPEIHTRDSSSYNRLYIKRLWTSPRNNGSSNDNRRKNSLAWALFVDYFKTTRFPQIILAINIAARIGQAIALGNLMEQFVVDRSVNITTNRNAKAGYFWCGILILCGLIAFPTKQRLYFEVYRKGMQIRIGLVATLFDKALNLSSTDSSLQSVNAGQLTNLASNDVERFLSAAIPSLYLILGPLEAIAILIVGLHVIGPVFAVGHGIFLMLVPLQFYLGRRFVQFRSQVAAITDSRAGLLGQAISGARIIKMNGWELEFEKRITALRSKEVAKLQAASRFKALNDAIYYFSSIVVAVFIFTAHVLMGGHLSPRSVYTTLALLNILHISITKQIPNAVMNLSECFVCSERIQKFLELSENEFDSDHTSYPQSSSQTLISVSNVSCIWNKVKKKADKLQSSMNIALNDISLSFESHNLYYIVGSVGCGKSALLQALAGELSVFKGKIKRNYASIAYAAQDPWIMNGSIRDNITMGLPFKKEWYNQVIDACSLSHDIDGFLHGDHTVVGDRGVQCSGGQKARIGLARTFYQDPQVLLLDDPFSAIDSTVASSIYYSAIQNLGIKRGKCIILASHQRQFIHHSNMCIVLEKGEICSFGPLDTSLAFSSKAVANERKAALISREKTKNSSITDLSRYIANPKSSNIPINKEKRKTGIIEWSTWIAYAHAAGGAWVCFGLFLLFLATQIAFLVTIVKVGVWAEQPIRLQHNPEWFAIIFGLCSVLISLSLGRAQFTFHLLILASKKLHNQMLRSVLRSCIVFFDTNPLGRILNRFSADVGITDEALPLTIYDFLVGFFMVLGGIFTASTVLPFVLIALPPLIWYFLRLRLIFVTTTRELKRLEGMARSPIYAQMSETLHGIATIRANNCSNYFKAKFEELHDAHTRAYFAFVASSRWFATRMDILSFTLMSTASFLAVVFHDRNWFEVDPSVLGLSLTILLHIAGTNFPWIVRQSAEIVNQMVSVERVLDFGNLPPEAPFVLANDSKELAESWPKHGEISFQNLAVRYRPTLPLALDDVSFSFPAGARVGIVGRTGSGKSTIVQSLFRLLEAEHGSIYIDGKNISKIGLHRLRTKVSVIPQMPTLFSGCSVRENLDFLGIHHDEEIVKIIHDVQLGDVISQLPKGLDSIVSEGGSNFSVGQRQLLCLARAILSKNKILLLDEATASVDRHTDQLLQKSLHASFQDSTIIAVAHRLDTVIDYDFILVMGNGKVIEFGSPVDLLSSGGYFKKMVDDTGKNMSQEMHERVFGIESHQYDV